MLQTYTVEIKPGCRHGRLHANYDAKRPTGNPGPYAVAGDTITVSQDEMDAFGDKFILRSDAPVTVDAPKRGRPRKAG